MKFNKIHFDEPLTNSPVGLKINTNAIITNIIPSTNNGNPTDPIDRVIPRIRAAIKAPGIDPIPPITVTIKLSINIPNPIPGVNDLTGAPNAPAIPANAHPSPNNNAKYKGTLIPNADTIFAFSAAALTILPNLVFEIKKIVITPITKDKIIRKAYNGGTKPPKILKGGNLNSSGTPIDKYSDPQIILTKSSVIKIKA